MRRDVLERLEEIMNDSEDSSSAPSNEILNLFEPEAYEVSGLSGYDQLCQSGLAALQAPSSSSASEQFADADETSKQADGGGPEDPPRQGGERAAADPAGAEDPHHVLVALYSPGAGREDPRRETDHDDGGDDENDDDNDDDFGGPNSAAPTLQLVGSPDFSFGSVSSSVFNEDLIGHHPPLSGRSAGYFGLPNHHQFQQLAPSLMTYDNRPGGFVADYPLLDAGPAGAGAGQHVVHADLGGGDPLLPAYVFPDLHCFGQHQHQHQHHQDPHQSAFQPFCPSSFLAGHQQGGQPTTTAVGGHGRMLLGGIDDELQHAVLPPLRSSSPMPAGIVSDELRMMSSVSAGEDIRHHEALNMHGSIEGILPSPPWSTHETEVAGNGPHHSWMLTTTALGDPVMTCVGLDAAHHHQHQHQHLQQHCLAGDGGAADDDDETLCSLTSPAADGLVPIAALVDPCYGGRQHLMREAVENDGGVGVGGLLPKTAAAAAVHHEECGDGRAGPAATRGRSPKRPVLVVKGEVRSSSCHLQQQASNNSCPGPIPVHQQQQVGGGASKCPPTVLTTTTTTMSCCRADDDDAKPRHLQLAAAAATHNKKTPAGNGGCGRGRSRSSSLGGACAGAGGGGGGGGGGNNNNNGNRPRQTSPPSATAGRDDDEPPAAKRLDLKNLTEDMLRDWKVQDLNRQLKGMPKELRIKVKKERRTLKNRVYAHNSRHKKNSELKECKEELARARDLIQKRESDLGFVLKKLDRHTGLMLKFLGAWDKAGEGAGAVAAGTPDSAAPCCSAGDDAGNSDKNKNPSFGGDDDDAGNHQHRRRNELGLLAQVAAEMRDELHFFLSGGADAAVHSINNNDGAPFHADFFSSDSHQ